MAQNDDDGKDLPDDFSQDMERMLKERINEWTPPAEMTDLEVSGDILHPETKSSASAEDSITSSSKTSEETHAREEFVRPSDALDAGVEADQTELPIVDPTADAPEHRSKPRLRLNLTKPYVEAPTPTSDPKYSNDLIGGAIPPAFVTEGEIRSVDSKVWPQEHVVEKQIDLKDELAALFIKTDARADSMGVVEIQRLINAVEKVQIRMQHIAHALTNKRDKKLAKASEFELTQVDIEKSKGRPKKAAKPKRESDPDKSTTPKVPSFPSVKVADRNAYKAAILPFCNTIEDVSKIPGMLAKFAVNPELRAWFEYELGLKAAGKKIPETT
jgi:hypothetical protein